jgi:dihydroanticapsin dehydrogenase
MLRLKDKVASITGAASGIGRATAEVFAEEGATIVAADINSLAGEEVVEFLRERNHSALFVATDISNESDAEKLSVEAVRLSGRIDILINCAAGFVWKGLEATPADWRLSVDVNIIGTALVTKHAAEEMKKGDGGAIVNLASISSFIAQPNFITYSATKGAILQMTRNMAIDLAPHHIRVNAVCPGTILTPTVEK